MKITNGVKRSALCTKSFVRLLLFIAGTIADLLKGPFTLCDLISCKKRFNLCFNAAVPQRFTRSHYNARKRWHAEVFETASAFASTLTR